MSPHRWFFRSLTAAAVNALLLAAVFALVPASSSAESDRRAPPQSVTPVVRTDPGVSFKVVGSAIVNATDLARIEKRRFTPLSEPRVWQHDSAIEENEMDLEPGANVVAPPGAQMMFAPPPFVPFVASPSPANSFQGLDDIAMADSNYIIIPPDVSGGVGPSKVMCGFNNNYRIQDKTTGATLLTVGTATFWNPVIANKTLLNQLTDPRTTYDPIQNRWIVAMQTVNTNGLVLFGVSFTSDPAGSWYLYAVQLSTATGSYLMDFPTLGFNKNWICVSINRYTTAGAFSRGTQVVANYAQAANGTLSSVTIFDPGTGTGVRFCAAPCVTISATEDTLFLPTHLGSAGATYQVDVITGTPSVPVYTSGSVQTRPGGGWTQPSGNQLPQSAPNAGASACGATPCPIEAQDAQIRSAPTYRLDSTTGRAFIYYTQSIRLTTPATRNLVQWTKLTPGGGGTTPVLADGGRIDDATGVNWYSYPHIAVNSVGDFIVGYSRFGSGVHPSAGYSIHFASEGLGSIRDPLSYKVGEDYYHKTFTTTTGRNRWGDFSTCQVDPCDDRSLWTLQEYGKTRTGTDDGNTGSNSSKWSSYWGVVTTTLPTVTIAPGPSLNEGNAGTTSFTFTVNLSSCSAVPVTVNYQTADGSATVADNDYQPATSSIVIPIGSTSGTITVLVNGDTKCEANETFSVNLTGATNGTIGGPSTSTGTILNDDPNPTITATAGSGGSISPSGATTVACGGSQGYSIGPSDKCHFIADVKVDGVSVGAVASYTFTNVTSNHTIDAMFSTFGPFKLSSSAGAGGSISPSGSTVVACGGGQQFTIGPADKCHAIQDVKVDGVSVGAVSSYTFTDIQANHDIVASFYALGPFKVTSAAGAGGSISPSGSTVIACGDAQKFSIGPADKCHAVADVKVDGVSVGPVSSYSFVDVQANHDIVASFYELGPFKISASAGSGGSISPDGSTVITCGGAQKFSIGPADKCHAIADVKVDGVSVGAVSSYAFADVQANHEIEATFTTLGPFKVSASAGSGGSISPDGSTVIACGGAQKFSIGPADKCHAIADVKVDGVSVGAVSSYAFADVQANHEIEATFTTLGPFKVSASAGSGGSISPDSSTVIACGGAQKFSIGPADKCHAIADVKVDGVSVGAVSSYAFADVQANHDIVASFLVYGPFTITATAGSGGSISPSGATSVACGGGQPYTITPSSGYVIYDVKVDGVSVGPVASYTFSDVQANHTIDASFTAPVATLGSFMAQTLDDGVELRWRFETPVSAANVTLERASGSLGPYASVAADVRTEGEMTVATDRTAAAGATYWYRLSVTSASSPVETFGPVIGTAGIPIHAFELTSVKPNPSAGAVQIEYAVPRDGPLQLSVLDIQGRTVAVLSDGVQPRGRFHSMWSGQTTRGAAPAGMYFVRLHAAGVDKIKRVVLVR